MTEDIDVLIVGARVAGAALGINLLDSGLRVRLIDRSTLDAPVISSAFLWPAGCRELDRLALLEAVTASHPKLERWSEVESTADPVPYTPLWPAPGFALNPDRPFLDRLLTSRLTNSGTICWGTDLVSAERLPEDRIKVVLRQGGKLREVTTRWLVGADGRWSAVGRLMSVPVLRSHEPYRRWIVARFTELDWNRGTILSGMYGSDWFGVSASINDTSTVSLSLPLDPRTRVPAKRLLMSRLSAVPALARATGRGRLLSCVGTGRAGGVHRQPVGRGWILVGDAALATEPITGTGITVSLHSAALASRVIVEFSEGGRHDAADEYTQWLAQTADRLLRFTSTPPSSVPKQQASVAADRIQMRINFSEVLVGQVVAP